MCCSSFINSNLTFSEVLELELTWITSMAEHSPVPSTSGFHICDIWSYVKAFFMNHFPYNVHLVSADKIDTHKGKRDAQEQPLVDQEFKLYGGEKTKRIMMKKGTFQGVACSDEWLF